MADAKAAPTSGVGVKTNSIETAEGAEQGGSMIREDDGSFSTTTENRGAQHTDPGPRVKNADGVDEPEAGGEQQQVDKTKEAEVLKEDTGSKDETLAELPDFDAAKPETVAAYDKAFTKEDGGLNIDAFSAQWWGSVKDGDLTKGTLTDGTYAYLEKQYGLTKDEVKDIEAGQIAQRQAEAGSLTARAGGVEVYKAALAWGREGGYTAEQVAAFNAATNGKNRETANDAVDLLMARFDKASRSGVKPRKSPSTNSTKDGADGAKGGGETFASRDDWLAARKAAGKDMVKQQAVSNKFRKSNSKSW